MNGGHHPRDYVARLYVSKKHGGRGLISVEDCINQARLSMKSYVQSSEEELLKAVREEDSGSQETATSFKARRMERNGKKSHCMDSFQERLKTKVMRRHGPGSKGVLKEREKHLLLLHKIKQYELTTSKQESTNPK